MASQDAVLATGHTDMVHDVKYDYTGRYVATCSSDSTIGVFECLPGYQRHIATLEGHSAPVWSLSWAHPKFNSVLASGSYDGTVIVWQQSGAGYDAVYTYKGHKSSVNGVAWAPLPSDRPVVASVSSDSSIAVNAYDNGSWHATVVPNAHQIGVNCVAWDPRPVGDGVQRFVTGGADNMARVWERNLATYAVEPAGTVLPDDAKTYQDWVRDVAFCPHRTSAGSLLAVCSGNKVYLFGAKEVSGRAQWVQLEKKQLPATVYALAWDEHDTLFVATCADHKAYVFKNANPTTFTEWNQVSSHSLQ